MEAQARTEQIKDLRILLDERFSFKHHINDKINKALSMLGIIKRNFKHLTIQSFTILYKNMVRSHLDYCSSVWSPYMKKDIEALEKIQKELPRFCQSNIAPLLGWGLFFSNERTQFEITKKEDKI